MAYIVTKRIRKNGKVYEYKHLQESYRVGKKVKTRYLGRIDWHATLGSMSHGFDHDAAMKEHGERYRASVAEQDAKMAALHQELHDKFGFRVGPSDPVPVDKPATQDPTQGPAPAASAPDAPGPASPS